MEKKGNYLINKVNQEIPLKILVLVNLRTKDLHGNSCAEALIFCPKKFPKSQKIKAAFC